MLLKSASAFDNRAKGLKSRLKMFMEMKAIKKIEATRYTVSVAANGGLQSIQVDQEKLTAEFIRRQIVVSPDGDKIREAIAAGNAVEGAVLIC